MNKMLWILPLLLLGCEEQMSTTNSTPTPESTASQADAQTGSQTQNATNSNPTQVEEHKVLALIEVNRQDGIWNITPYCVNQSGTDLNLRYELVSMKDGQSGKSNNRQSSSFQILDGEKKSLSQLSMNLSPQDHYLFHLSIYENGNLIAEKILTPTTEI